MPSYFTSITLIDKCKFESLKLFLTKKTDKWFLVHEYGQSGVHHHVHIYLSTDAWADTKTVTSTIRKEIFSHEVINEVRESAGTTRYMVSTRSVKGVSGMMTYMYKQQMTYEGLEFHNFDKAYLQNEFKKVGIKNISLTRTILTMTAAPYKINELIEKDSPITFQIIMDKLALLIQNNYICHHLFDEKTLCKIKLAIKAIRGEHIYFDKLKNNFSY